MRSPLYDYRLAPGYNVALDALTNIELIKPTGDIYFYPPRVYPTYNPGLYRIRGDGSVYLAGYGAQLWHFGVLTYAQYEYLRTTYCSGGFSGPLTIYTRLATVFYQRCNAMLILPKPADSDDGRSPLYLKNPVQMTRLVLAS